MLLMFMAQMKQQNVQRRRRAWVRPRPQNWFKTLLASPALNFLWKKHFKVTRETFEYLCDLVRANLQKQHTRFRVPVSSEKRVGLALWRLATVGGYSWVTGVTVGIRKVNSENRL